MSRDATPLRRKTTSFRALPPALRRRAPAAFVALSASSLGLRLLGFARVYRWLERSSRRDRRDVVPAALDVTELDVTELDARAVALAARNLPLRALCLERSLALWWLLRRRGVDAELRIGVRRPEGRLEAHAWVESAGRVVGDVPDVCERYAVFDGDVATIAAAIR